jgi:hypothetical protein
MKIKVDDKKMVDFMRNFIAETKKRGLAETDFCMCNYF